LNPQDINAPDEVLRRAVREFGSTIEDAVKVRTRQINSEVDYAIISDAGELLFEADWFPLKTEPSSIAQLAQSRGLVRRGGKSYLLVSKAISDSRGKEVGTIIVPKEVTGEEQVIRPTHRIQRDRDPGILGCGVGGSRSLFGDRGMASSAAGDLT
jgi:hypothetical protein